MFLRTATLITSVSKVVGSLVQGVPAYLLMPSNAEALGWYPSPLAAPMPAAVDGGGGRRKKRLGCWAGAAA
jgi:hypothetical protein